MLVSLNGEILNDKFNQYKLGGCTHYYHGLIFMKGKKAGEETVKNIAQIFIQTGKVPFSDIYGSYSYAIKKEDNTVIAFSDNSNLHCLYIGKNYIGSSFLEIVEKEREKCTDLSFYKESVCESLTLGRIYFGKTLVKSIRCSTNTEWFVISNNMITVNDKNIGDISAKSKFKSLSEFLGMVSDALSDLKVCQGLTGGYDTRLLFTCLKKNMRVKPFISGDVKDNTDIVVAGKVADAAGVSLDIIETKKPYVNEAILMNLFRFNDGMIPFADESTYRIYDFIHNRVDEGFDVYITGDGGVLHKDWDWLQDLPFYRKRNTDLNKFFDQRIAFLSRKNNLSKDMIDFYGGQEKRFIDALRKFIKPTNTQSYDNLYYSVTGNRSVYYNTCADGLLNYAPLTELEAVRYSYALPRFQRFFYNNMRKVITSADKIIARIPTNYGTTASSEFRYILRDVFYQGIDYLKKACRMLGRKVLHKNLFVDSVLSWSFTEDLVNLKGTEDAVEYCKRVGYLSDSCTVNDLNKQQLNSVLYIFFVARECAK